MYFSCAQRKQKGFAPLVILVGIVFIGVAIGGAYYFGKSQAPKPQLPNPVVISPTPQATPSDETASWKTYTAAKFSFKYPSSWDLQTCGVPEGIYLDDDRVNCAGGSSAISIMNTFTKKFSFSDEKSRGILVKETNISLGGYNALQAEIDTGKVSSNSNFRYTITRVKIEDSIYDLTIEYNQFLDEDAARRIYNQILSTFKFTN